MGLGTEQYGGAAGGGMPPKAVFLDLSSKSLSAGVVRDVTQWLATVPSGTQLVLSLRNAQVDADSIGASLWLRR